MLRDRDTEQVQTLIEGPAAPFDQAVGGEQQRAAGGQDSARLGTHRGTGGGCAEQNGVAAVEEPDGPVDVLDERREVPGVGVAEHGAVAVQDEPAIERGREPLVGQVLRQLVEVVQDGGGLSPCVARWRNRARSRRLAVAATRSCPVTSPTALPTTPGARGRASPQSPPVPVLCIVRERVAT